jgi:hypothetical protein
MEHWDVVGSRKENVGGFGRNVPVLLLAVSLSTRPFDVNYAYVLGREEKGQALHIFTRLRCKTGTRCIARGRLINSPINSVVITISPLPRYLTISAILVSDSAGYTLSK